MSRLLRPLSAACGLGWAAASVLGGLMWGMAAAVDYWLHPAGPLDSL